MESLRWSGAFLLDLMQHSIGVSSSCVFHQTAILWQKLVEYEVKGHRTSWPCTCMGIEETCDGILEGMHSTIPEKPAPFGCHRLTCADYREVGRVNHPWTLRMTTHL